jgi:uncharacterized Zn-finger protein
LHPIAEGDAAELVSAIGLAMSQQVAVRHRDTESRPPGADRTAPADGESPTSRPASTRVIEITTAELPLACPRVGDPVVFDHPRVYFGVLETGEALCPYCGTLYRLRTAAHLHDHQFGGCDLHQHRPPLRHEVTATHHDEPAATQPHPAGVVDRFGRTTLEQITDWLRGIHR